MNTKTPDTNKLFHAFLFDASVFVAFIFFRNKSVSRLLTKPNHKTGLALLSFEQKVSKQSKDIINSFYFPRYVIYQVLSLSIQYFLPQQYSYTTPLIKLPVIFCLFLSSSLKMAPFILGLGILATGIKYQTTNELQQLL